jgi:hypothetical protein
MNRMVRKVPKVIPISELPTTEAADTWSVAGSPTSRM